MSNDNKRKREYEMRTTALEELVSVAQSDAETALAKLDDVWKMVSMIEMCEDLDDQAHRMFGKNNEYVTRPDVWKMGKAVNQFMRHEDRFQKFSRGTHAEQAVCDVWLIKDGAPKKPIAMFERKGRRLLQECVAYLSRAAGVGLPVPFDSESRKRIRAQGKPDLIYGWGTRLSEDSEEEEAPEPEGREDESAAFNADFTAEDSAAETEEPAECENKE